MEAYLHTRDGDDGQDQNSHADDGEIDGVFEADPDRITLRIPASGQPDLYTFAHEYGHYVWFNLLSRDDRRRYEGLYRKQKAAAPSGDALCPDGCRGGLRRSLLVLYSMTPPCCSAGTPFRPSS